MYTPRVLPSQSIGSDELLTCIYQHNIKTQHWSRHHRHHITPCVPVTLSVTFLVSQAPLNRAVKIGIIWAVWFFRFATEYSGGHKRWLYFFRGAWKMQNIIPGGFYFANIFSGGRDKKFRGAWSMFLDIQGGSFQVEEKAPLNIYSQRAYIHCQRHNGPRMAGMRWSQWLTSLEEGKHWVGSGNNCCSQGGHGHCWNWGVQGGGWHDIHVRRLPPCERGGGRQADLYCESWNSPRTRLNCVV